jgi:hypothetical protein
VHHRVGHDGARPVRHGDGELSCVTSVVALRVRGAREAGNKCRGKRQRGKSPKPLVVARLKRKGRAPPALNVGPTMSRKRWLACACPGVTGACPRDTSILIGPGSLDRLRSVPSNRLVRRIGRDARATHVVHIIHAAHDVLDYLSKTTKDHDNTTTT